MSRYDVASEPTAAQIASNYEHVRSVIASAAATTTNGNAPREVQLVAVSKTKSPQCLQHLYDLGHRVFGENYVQELAEKCKAMPQDITWHFIGHLQSNKVKELLSEVPQLSVIETVDSAKLADKLNAGCARYRDGRPLQVYIQVNTSGEESKSGVEPHAATVQLARYITKECPHLQLKGLMTIGMPDYSSRPENFTSLVQCRAEVAAALQIPTDSLQLSMGMSNDYKQAIEMGATSVRVGSSLFGTRYYPPKADATK